MGQGEYKRRRPEETALYRLIGENLDTFRSEYNERYGDIYGFYRYEMDEDISKYLKCGILKYGFARIKCQNKKCGKEYLLPFSCKSRGICPSCIRKYALDLEILLLDEIFKEVPYRHIIFTIPKILRKNFIWHREKLNDLSRLAWKCLKEFMSETLNLDGVPGSIQSIETNGQFLDINPHIHTLVTDGGFDAYGKFYKMPRYDYRARKYLKTLWENKVARYCVDAGFVQEKTMIKMLNWDYTGFSVYSETRMEYKRDDKKSRNDFGHMIRYIAKAPIAKDNVTYNSNKVIYKGSYHPAVKQNFRVYDPLDFMAALAGISSLPQKEREYLENALLRGGRCREICLPGKGVLINQGEAVECYGWLQSGLLKSTHDDATGRSRTVSFYQPGERQQSSNQSAGSQ